MDLGQGASAPLIEDPGKGAHLTRGLNKGARGPWHFGPVL